MCQQVAHGQADIEIKTIQEYASRYTRAMPRHSSNPEKERIYAFSYIVWYNQRAELDTILLSALPGITPYRKNMILEHLKEGFNKLPSEGFDLANTGILVLVQVIPMYVNYRINLTAIGSTDDKNAQSEWGQAFPVINPSLVGDKQLKYIAPIIIRMRPPMEK